MPLPNWPRGSIGANQVMILKAWFRDSYMAKLSDTGELRRSLQVILELSLKMSQRLDAVLKACSERTREEK